MNNTKDVSEITYERAKELCWLRLSDYGIDVAVAVVYKNEWVPANDEDRVTDLILDALDMSADQYGDEEELAYDIDYVVSRCEVMDDEECHLKFLENMQDLLSNEPDVKLCGLTWTAYEVWENMTTETDQRAFFNDWLDSKFKE